MRTMRKTGTASTLDVNIDDKGKVEAGIGRVDHLFQHRLHTHILLISPPGGVREDNAESVHARR
jgi:hypothetical protein